MFFLSIAACNLARRPMRSGLTGLGIAVAVASLVMLVGLAQGLEGAWSQSLLDRGVHILVSQKGAVEVLTGTVDQKEVSALAREPGVAEAAGELVALTTLAQGRTVIAAGWDLKDYLWKTLELVNGSLPDRREQVVLGEKLAQALGLKPGGFLDLLGHRFEVAGVSRSQSALNLGAVFLPLESLQELAGKRKVVTFVNLRLKGAADEAVQEKMRGALAARFPGLEFQPTAEVTKENRILGIFRAMAWGTSFLAIIISALFVLNTMVMSVSERTREIGILSAVGWSRARIMALVLLEGALLTILSGLIGILAGTVGMALLTSQSEIGAFIQPRLSGVFLLQAGASVILLGALGSAYPAWRAMRLNTAQALRQD